jgi:predicted nucleotidyltransferase
MFYQDSCIRVDITTFFTQGRVCSMYMQAHHLKVVERLKELFQDDPRYLAMLVGGSLAKGWGSVNSDVDILLVVTEEEFARRVASDDLGYINTEICDYPDGYVDGKIINEAFLHEVAQRGSEPARAAFINVQIAFSHLPHLNELLKQIPVYQEHEREQKMRAFYCQIQAHRWFIGEAAKRQAVYLMAHATSEMVFYSARLILAYNHMLYPFHKWLMRAVEDAPEKPADFLTLAETLLREGTVANAEALWNCINNFRDWQINDSWGVRFMQDTEWTWRNGQTPLADW